MITRRRLALASGAALLAVHSPTRSQSRPKLRRVGSLSITSIAASQRFYDAFKLGMHDLGWREGHNVEYRFLFADGQVERLDALARELLAQRVEVIVAGAPQAAGAAQRATSTVPIVMANVSNAVGNKFVASLARPGGNITGVTAQNEVVLAKLVELLHEAVPQARRIAVVLNETNPSHSAFWTAAQSAAAQLRLLTVRVVASAPEHLGAAAAQIAAARVQAVVVVADGMYISHRAALETLMRGTGLPVAYALREHVQGGGLLSYSADIARNYRYAAGYVDKILKGAKPADLPVEQPTHYELVVNLVTAKTLGLVLPAALLLRANEVIQ